MNATQLCVFRLGPARFIDFTMREFLRQGWRAHLIKLNKTFAAVSGRALDGYLHAAPPPPAAGAVPWLST